MAAPSTTILKNVIPLLKKFEPEIIQHEVPIVWSRALGCYVWDSDMNRYLDFTSGIFVANVGHSNRNVIKAIKEELTRPLLHSYIFPSDARGKLIAKMVELFQVEKVLLTVTGSEANEAALQMMKRNRVGQVLAIKGAYYGSTTAVRQLAKEAQIDESILPDRFNPLEISGLFLQAFRGRDAKFMPKEWIEVWCDWAKENYIPIAWDEMQSGIGRTGEWFGFQHYNVKPDLICVGKAFGGGLPISCVMGKGYLLKFADDLWSTHTGNPICCASAYATLTEIENNGLIYSARVIGSIIEEELGSIGFPLNGRGAIWAVDLGNVEFGNRVVDVCAEERLLLVKTHAGTIKIAPPLVVSSKELLRGLKILKGVIKRCSPIC